MHPSIASLVVALGLLSAPASGLPASPASQSPGDPEDPTVIFELQPAFSWSAVEGATSYELEVWEGAKPALKTPVTVSGSSWSPSGKVQLNPGSLYRWRVRSVDAAGATSAWSADRHFRVRANWVFWTWWAVSFAALVFIAWLAGRKTGKGNLGILIDSRGRYSLTHFQTVAWALLILSSLAGVFLAHGFDPRSLVLNATLLGLLGISAGSAVAATGVKGAKDAPGSVARIARATPLSNQLSLSTGATRTIQAHWTQMFLEEEGDQADQSVSVTKYQNFIFTLVIALAYIALTARSCALPELPANVVWLIGISHAGYVGGKAPNKS